MKRILNAFPARVVLVFAVLSGFLLAGSPAGAEEKPTLLILPFLADKEENTEKGAFCPVCETYHRHGEIQPGAHKTVTRALFAKVDLLERFRIVPQDQVEVLLAKEGIDRFEGDPRNVAVSLGKELGVQFVMVGYLFRFRDRVGAALSAERPASVGLDLHLFRVRDGRMVWGGRFDETQQPLSENLFKLGSFLRRKASWVTGEELAAVGMGEMLKKLPSTKTLEEMK